MFRIHRRCQGTESGRSTMPPFFRYLNPPMISEVHKNSMCAYFLHTGCSWKYVMILFASGRTLVIVMCMRYFFLEKARFQVLFHVHFIYLVSKCCSLQGKKQKLLNGTGSRSPSLSCSDTFVDSLKRQLRLVQGWFCDSKRSLLPRVPSKMNTRDRVAERSLNGSVKRSKKSSIWSPECLPSPSGSSRKKSDVALPWSIRYFATT